MDGPARRLFAIARSAQLATISSSARNMRSSIASDDSSCRPAMSRPWDSSDEFALRWSPTTSPFGRTAAAPGANADLPALPTDTVSVGPHSENGEAASQHAMSATFPRPATSRRSVSTTTSATARRIDPANDPAIAGSTPRTRTGRGVEGQANGRDDRRVARLSDAGRSRPRRPRREHPGGPWPARGAARALRLGQDDVSLDGRRTRPAHAGQRGRRRTDHLGSARIPAD